MGAIISIKKQACFTSPPLLPFNIEGSFILQSYSHRPNFKKKEDVSKV